MSESVHGTDILGKCGYIWENADIFEKTRVYLRKRGQDARTTDENISILRE